VSREEWALRIKAAASARSNKPSSPLIIARTDSIQTHGLDEAIERIKIAREAGADIGFVEAPLSKDDAIRVVHELKPLPMVLNLPTNGATPNFTNEEALEMGFRITWHPLAGAMASVHALRKAYHDVTVKGTDVETAQGMGPREFFQGQSEMSKPTVTITIYGADLIDPLVMGLDKSIAFEKEISGGRLYQRT
jgi:2-methylisocitrate lyase-like PEP mutase family enzyme